MKQILWFGVALAFGACSLKKTADQMKNATGTIKTDSDQLAKRTDDLEGELTFKESSLMMLQGMRWLWGEADRGYTASVAVPSETDALVYAGITIKSMWFQFWKGDYHEDLNSLDERFELGAEFLFTRIKSHAPFNHVVNVFGDADYQGVGALAAKLDFVRPEFSRALARAGLPPITFYDVVVLALKNRDVVNPHTSFPRAVQKILEYADDATYLLQLRHNFLPMMVVASVTDFKDRSSVGRAWQKIRGAPQAIDLKALKPAQLREWTHWLKLAQRTRDDLTHMGIVPERNENMMSFVDALTPVDPLTHDAASSLRGEFRQALTSVQ